MKKSEIFQKVKAAMANNRCVKKCEISLEDFLEKDLGAVFFVMLDVFDDIDEEFGISTDAEVVQQFKQVKDVVDYLFEQVISQKVKAIIVDEFCLEGEEDKVTPETHICAETAKGSEFLCLEGDIVDKDELFQRLEKEFKLSLSDEDFFEFVQVKDIVRILKNKLS